MTEKKRQRKQKSISWSMINWWKWAFLILIGLILGSGIWFTKTVLAPVSLNTATETKTISNDPVFTVKVTKSSANRIMAHYLKTYLKDSPIKYAVTLGNNEAALNGSFKFLGNNVKFQLTFDPLVLYYIDIDKVLSNGETVANKASAKEALKEATSGDGNPLIFSQDHFHPNNAGYAQMTKQLMTKLTATKKDWE